MVASVPYGISFASHSKKNCDFIEAYITYKLVFLDFYVAAPCNLAFKICGSYVERV